MKKYSFIFWYIIIPAAAAFGVKKYLECRRSRITHELPKLCLRPVGWKVTVEK